MGVKLAGWGQSDGLLGMTGLLGAEGLRLLPAQE